MGSTPEVFANGSLVLARADEYVPFEPRSASQFRLRDTIRQAASQLVALPGSVLHASFCGHKPPGADVENLLLYNIDSSGRCFRSATRYGIRFELSSEELRSHHLYSYSYELVALEDTFVHWRPVRELASWDWTELGAFAGDKKLEQVWLALSREPASIAERPRNEGAPFSLGVLIRPPAGKTATLAPLVKGVIDGAISAFEAHSDSSSLGELSARLARRLPASAEDLRTMLVDRRRAVLGVVPRLLHIRGQGVAWASTTRAISPHTCTRCDGTW